MRLFLLQVAMLVSLGACDLKPPVKQEKPGVTGAGSAAASEPAAPAPPSVNAAVTPDAFDVSQPCLDVATHITAVLLAEAKDPAFEQDQTKIVRRAAEGCTRDHWPEAALACFRGASTVAAMEVCGKDLKAP